MKLQKKISLYFFSISFLVFLLTSIFSYFVLKSLVLEEVDETLEAEKNHLITQLLKFKDSENIPSNYLYRLEFIQIDNNRMISETFSDTLLFVGEESESIPFRQITFSKFINGMNFKIMLRQSLIEKEDFITGITGIFIAIFFLTIISLNATNYFGEKKWWKPFYETLDKLSDFKLTHKRKMCFGHSDIDEFNQLNKTLEELTEKVRNDYQNLKEFSENASHEMQTPLAIIRSKLDVMIQDASLNEKQFDSIRSLYDAANRLSRLNQSLNLLTKIENKEFSQKGNVNISLLIEQQMNNFKELIESKSLQVQSDVEENVFVQLNPFIANALISNLLINAIKHNLKRGVISIELTRNKLTIKNSGKPPQVSTDKLFERFKKDNQTSDSSGLGLSIVKKICELNNYNIDYNYVNQLHRIQLSFHK